MALKYTLKKKDNENDERTVNASEFIDRLLSLKQRQTEKVKEVPKTETTK
ncbi:MAG: hypothetical protein J1E57_00930 [Prevotella sp.]|nr:hypothetical protein [Prevotella sp.]